MGISEALFEQRFQRGQRVHLEHASSTRRRPNKQFLHRIISYLETPSSPGGGGGGGGSSSEMNAADDGYVTSSTRPAAGSGGAARVRRAGPGSWLQLSRHRWGRSGEETLSLPGSVSNELELSAMSPAEHLNSGASARPRTAIAAAASAGVAASPLAPLASPCR